MGASSGLLVFLNVLYILGGVGCLVLGTLGITEVLEDVPDVAGKAVWYMIYHLPNVEPEDVFDDDGVTEYDVGYTVLLVSGVVLLLMGFAGAIGTVRRNGCLLTTAWIVLSLVLVIVLIVAVAFPIFAWVKTKADCNTEEEKYEVLYEYVHKNKTVRVLIDFDEVQKKYECCGVRNTSDWVKAADAGGVIDIVPFIPNSCCGKPVDGDEACALDEIYDKSCDEDIDEWLQDNVYLKLVICLAIGILLSFILIASIALTCLILRKMDRGEKI